MERPKLRKVALEVAYTAAAAGLLFSVYLGMSPWLRGGGDAQEVDRAMKEISDRPVIVVGKQLSIAGANVERSPYSLVIVTSPTCVFCEKSLDFHRRLVDAARQVKLPVWIAVPPVSSSKGFLVKAGLEREPTAHWADLDRRFQGTPSVVLVGGDRVIKAVWLGELRKDKESEVLAAIADPAHARTAGRRLSNDEPMLTKPDFEMLAAQGPIRLISLDERERFLREHPDGAINLPLAELGMRAGRILMKEGLNVFDCSAIADVVCTLAVDQMRRKGYRMAAVDFGQL